MKAWLIPTSIGQDTSRLKQLSVRKNMTGMSSPSLHIPQTKLIGSLQVSQVTVYIFRIVVFPGRAFPVYVNCRISPHLSLTLLFFHSHEGHAPGPLHSSFRYSSKDRALLADAAQCHGRHGLGLF